LIRALEAIAVEDADFVASQEEDAALAAVLGRRFGRVRNAKIDVEPERAEELLAADDVAFLSLHDAAGKELPAGWGFAVGFVPAFEVLAVEEDDRSTRRRRAGNRDGVLRLSERHDLADVVVRADFAGRDQRSQQEEGAQRQRAKCESGSHVWSSKMNASRAR
jgi:hypothetical protein